MWLTKGVGQWPGPLHFLVNGLLQYKIRYGDFEKRSIFYSTTSSLLLVSLVKLSYPIKGRGRVVYLLSACAKEKSLSIQSFYLLPLLFYFSAKKQMKK